MASQKTVTAAVAARLDHDNPSRLAQAGTMWQALPLGFYYPSHEDAVDIAMLETLKGVVDGDQRALPHKVYSSVRQAISMETKVKAASMTSWLANLASEPAP
jgi:hypothetical protein